MSKPDRVVYDFLYGNPPHGGMPDSQIRIGVEFEVGGTYENWGWIVERLTHAKDSRPTAYTKRTLGTGRTLEKAIEAAKVKILKDLEASDQEKCWCGKAMFIYKVEGDKRIPLCMEHNDFTNPSASHRKGLEA